MNHFTHEWLFWMGIVLVLVTIVWNNSFKQAWNNSPLARDAPLTQVQLAVFKPKRTVVPVDRFLIFKHILVEKK